MLELIEQDDLIEQDGTEYEKLDSMQAFDGYLTAPLGEVHNSDMGRGKGSLSKVASGVPQRGPRSAL